MSKAKISVAAVEALSLYPKTLKLWPALVFVHILAYLSSELFSWQREEVLSSGREELLPIISVFTGAILTDIVFTTAWILVVIRAILTLRSAQKYERSFLGDLNSALIESTRALARMIRWFPIFIIPGIVKFIRLTFVPFVVIDEPRYQQGAIDALNRSERLVKQRFWLVVLALFLSSLVPAFPSLLFQGENISLASRPVASITLSVFEFFTGLLATIFLYCFYRQLVNEEASHAHI